MKGLVSIVIVNYYSEDDIELCIKSIKEKADAPCEIIVVTNSPWQEKQSHLKEEYPDVIWKETGYNAGYSVANNLGADNAKGEYLFFLNPDTTFYNGTLKDLIKSLDQTDVMIAGPYVEYPDGSPQPTVKFHYHPMMNFLLAFPIMGSMFPHRFSFAPILPKNSGAVDVVNGCALFIRSHDFHEIGKFAPPYFMYWEENDICLRAQKHGKRVWFCKESKIRHYESKTTKNVLISMELARVTSQKIFLEKYYPNWLLWDRVWGIFCYFERSLFCLLLLRKKKLLQFYSLFKWYLFKYKAE